MLKSIASNTLAQLTAKFFGAGLTLLTTFFTIRLAGLDLYGDLSKILVLVALGFTAIDFGLNADAVRRATTPTSMLQLTRRVMIARLALALLAIILLNTLVLLLPGGYSQEIKSLFWVASLGIIFQSIYTSGNAYFQHSLSYWRSTLSVILGTTTSTTLTLYYLWFSPTLFNLIIATTLGYLVMAVTTLLLLPKSLLKEQKTHEFKEIVPTILRSSTLGAILIFSILSSKIDTVLLGVFRTSSEVGQYSFAYRIFDVILVLPVFVMNSLYPLMLKNKKNLLTPTLQALGLLGILAAVATYLLAPAIILIKGELVLSITTLRILALSLPLFYLTAPLMWDLVARAKDGLVLKIYILAALLNLSCNLWAIPRYGAVSAAIITGITELLIFLSLLYYSLSLKKSSI